MTIQDPISDMIIFIKNGQISRKNKIQMISCKIKIEISKILKNEGYIIDYKVKENIKPTLEIKLKYFRNKPVIEYIKRISKPSLRIFAKKHKLPYIMSGFGIAIISTSMGLMTDHQARKIGIGGEVLCCLS